MCYGEWAAEIRHNKNMGHFNEIISVSEEKIYPFTFKAATEMAHEMHKASHICIRPGGIANSNDQ